MALMERREESLHHTERALRVAIEDGIPVGKGPESLRTVLEEAEWRINK